MFSFCSQLPNSVGNSQHSRLPPGTLPAPNPAPFLVVFTAPRAVIYAMQGWAAARKTQRADNKRETVLSGTLNGGREEGRQRKAFSLTHSTLSFLPLCCFQPKLYPLALQFGFPAPGAAARFRSGSPDPPVPHSPAFGGSLPQLLALSRPHSRTAAPGRLGQNRAGSSRAAAALCRPRRRPRLRGGVDGTASLGTAGGPGAGNPQLELRHPTRRR